MKTQAWKPSASADNQKIGVYVDELVQFCEISSGAVGEIPAVAAFVMAVEMIAKKQAFEIRDLENFEVWLKSDGERLSGSHSMHQLVHDTAEILDAIVKKNVKEFSDNVRSLIQQSAAASRPVAGGALPESPAAEVTADTKASVAPALEAPTQPQVTPDIIG